MRVLHVIPAVSPKYGGPSEALVPMCKALSKRGVDVQIASTDAEPRGRIRVELATPTAYQDVPVIFFKRQWSEAFIGMSRVLTWFTFMESFRTPAFRRPQHAAALGFHTLSDHWEILRIAA